ncbi:MAG: hypothetical protein HF978_05695 [Desulfobacteraceae bacterium]|nr:hypothetical protein [Desulfobacteraceae bacterium]MBC2755026.1 hypothetical protein [Desulfobacteraceae bacterium]
MDMINIQYAFKLDKQRSEIIDLQLDPLTLELVNGPGDDLPFWTKLDFHQCPHCPLNLITNSLCPVAAYLVDVVKRFENVLSYDEVDLEVTTSARHVFQRTTAQRGISSLLGVLFPASGCPHTAFFKPMVRFHLPLATEQDTIFRASGMFLLAQYFLGETGLVRDLNLQGLKQIYNNMNLLNMNIAERLRNAACTESSINAIVLLDVFAHTMPLVIEEQLEEIRHLFAPYFSIPTEAS